MNPDTAKQVADTVQTMPWPGVFFLVIVLFVLVIPIYYKMFWPKKGKLSESNDEACKKMEAAVSELKKIADENYEMMHDHELNFEALEKKVDKGLENIATVKEKIVLIEGLLGREEQDISKVANSVAQLTGALETLIKKI